MKPLITTKHTKGFTLVEIMISMVISLILLLGVSQIFSSNKRSSNVSGGLARVQENARFALKKMSADMRRAGYVGCAGTTNLENHLDTTSPNYDDDLFDFSKGTAGWEYTKGLGTSATQPGETYIISTVSPGGADGADNKWQNNNTEGLPASLSSMVVPGNDIIVMKWTGDELFNLNIDSMLTNKAVITTQTAHAIPSGTILIISDCSGSDVFQQVSTGNSKVLNSAKASGAISPGNKTPAGDVWGHLYPQGVNISYFLSKAYYIGEGASGEPSLYSISYNQGATAQLTEEVAEGIENMQILFGVDTNADDLPEKYVTAEQVADHGNVVSLKVGVIARSPNEVKNTPSSRNLNLLGTTITTPNDRNLRFVFTTTVKLRNKGAK